MHITRQFLVQRLLTRVQMYICSMNAYKAVLITAFNLVKNQSSKTDEMNKHGNFWYHMLSASRTKRYFWNCYTSVNDSKSQSHSNNLFSKQRSQWAPCRNYNLVKVNSKTPIHILSVNILFLRTMNERHQKEQGEPGRH